MDAKDRAEKKKTGNTILRRYYFHWSQSLVETLPAAFRQVCILVQDFPPEGSGLKTFFE